MSVAYVANRGSASVDSTFSLTWTFTTTGAVASGNKVILAIVTHGGGGELIDSVSGGGLTWTQDAKGANSDGEVSWLFSADAPSGMSSGTTITVVEHSGGDVFTKRRYELIEFSGLATGAPAGTHASGGSGTSTTPSSGASSAAAGIGDLAVGVIGWKATSISTDWTVTSGYTKENTLSSNARSAWFEYAILSGSGAVTSHPTTSLTTIQWSAAVCWYPATVTGFFGTAGLQGAGQIAATGTFSLNGTAHLQGAGQIAASGHTAVFGVAALVGHGSIAATGGLASAGIAALSGLGQILAVPHFILITVSGDDITATLTGLVTANELVAALNADGSASALVLSDIPSGDGTGVVTAL
jgi:hypothetical protein